jgi:hypothetical protein
VSVLYSPEDFGVETVAAFDVREPFYEFDTILTLRDPATGEFFVVHDSGCSCPVPFDDYTNRESLGRPLNAHEAVAEIDRLVEEQSYGSVSEYARNGQQRAVAAVMAQPRRPE